MRIIQNFLPSLESLSHEDLCSFNQLRKQRQDVFHIRRGAKTRRLLIHVTGLSADRLFHHAVRRDSFTAGSRSTEKAWASSATLSDWNRNSSSVPLRQNGTVMSGRNKRTDLITERTRISEEDTRSTSRGGFVRLVLVRARRCTVLPVLMCNGELTVGMRK